MSFFIHYLNNLVKKIANKEADNINKARVEMLIYIIAAYLIFSGILLIAYQFDNQPLQQLRVAFVFVTAILFILILNRNISSWRFISHFVICLITFGIWSNLLFYVRGVNIATLQYVWFACALGFYMHGTKWGWFYACINVIPILAFTITEANYFSIGGGAQKISLGSYFFVICYNFALIIFLHYYFFKAFNSNFIMLTQAKDELNVLNKKLNDTLYDLEQISNSRMDFLSTMSHELRTPMNGVIGISNALLYKNPREDQKEDLALLKFSTENLLSLINDILDFNKLEANKVTLESVDFDLALLVENNFATFALKAKEKKLDFNFSIDKQLQGKVVSSDPTRLTQVLLNLINNAIKFTDKGYVNIITRVLFIDSNIVKVRFTIEDTGIGIEAHKQSEIFEVFAQASSHTNRQYGGTGLGLPIVKRILEMFNSNIFIESKITKGTKMFFDIDFPYKEDSLADLKETEPMLDLSHLKILIAEDNLINILVIQRTLERWGIVPVIAENGALALEKITEEDFDVLLLDIYMPEMDGYETSKAIRNLADPVKANTHIIAFTATINNNIATKVSECGMNDYLPKPFSPQQLFMKLQQIVMSKSTT